MKKIFFLTILFLLLAQPAGAGLPTLENAFGNNSQVKKVGENSGYSSQTNQDTLNSIINNLISVLLSLLGVFFMVLMIYGGFLWMTASGDESKITKAKSLLTAAVIGLVIVISAYAISVFVIKAVQKNTIQTDQTAGQQ